VHQLGAARKVVEVNYLAVLSLTQLAYRARMAGLSGAVVNVVSLPGLRPPSGIAFYGVSKAMPISLIRGLAVELAPGERGGPGQVLTVDGGLVLTAGS
jgi:short-subunit dehydrogenase